MGSRIKQTIAADENSLKNKLLVSMPSNNLDFFTKSVIYICEHNEEGAMGIVINQIIPKISFNDLLKQMKLGTSVLDKNPILYLGGPVQTGRGFILHSNDYMCEDSVKVTSKILDT